MCGVSVGVVSGLLCCQDKEYTQLLGAMSERCEDYEEQLLTDEAKLKGWSHCTLSMQCVVI